MSRILLLALAIAACSSKAPVSSEPPSTTPEALGAPAPPSAAGPAAAPARDPREAALTAATLRALEHGHLLRRPIDDGISREAFATYLDRLDGGKLFLLRADRDELAAYADQIDDQLRAGKLTLAHEAARRYAERVVMVDGFVAQLLAAPLNHTDEESLEIDPDKLDPAATPQDLRDRWRRRLELEVMERVAALEARLEAAAAAAAKRPGGGSAAPEPPEDRAPIPPTREGRDAKVRADLAKQYSGRFARLRAPAPLDTAADLINAVASVIDPHTTYLPPADKANFDIQMTGSLEGIGAVLRERDHYVEVVEVVPGGASARQGQLAAGDLILAVTQEGQDPVDVFDMKIDDVVKMIRGPKGTAVRLRVQKPTGAQETLAIVRDVVVVEESYARGAVLTRKRGQPSYGYIALPSFYGGREQGQRTAAGDVGRLLRTLKARGVAGVILDLRGNAGGLLSDAVEITGELIDRGPVVQVQDSRGRREVLSDDDAGSVYGGPVLVLVDRFSASASEIVAAALQDYRRAIVVGTPTHGKGTVQTLADLDRVTGRRSELGSIKLTIQQFFRVNGASTQRVGVTPDVRLPDSAAYIETGERELKHAIPWAQIPAVPFTPLSPAWKLPVLAQQSATRVAKHPLLSKVAATTAALKAQRDATQVPLARPAWEARRAAQRAAIEAATLDPKTVPAGVSIKLIDEPQPDASGGAGGRLARWQESVAHDPWLEESLRILDDAR